ncbi:TetR/AcrR family transcriptional regulator [Streptomyces sp. Inha503]|uniref:TetR/AcrR family transcriptional regulator n=1 Tax=Streptomyces sp. Inha503 TaxID=3383314 RepID=UPI0039A213FB
MKSFTEHGYNGASMRQIAADVGVSPAALLRHFDGKEELLTAVPEWWSKQTTSITGDAEGGLAYIDQLRAVMRYHVEHRGLLELFIRLTGESSDEKHPARPFIQQRYATLVRTLVQRLLDVAATGQIPPLTDAQAEAEIRTLFATMDGLEIQWLLDRRSILSAASTGTSTRLWNAGPRGATTLEPGPPSQPGNRSRATPPSTIDRRSHTLWRSMPPYGNLYRSEHMADQWRQPGAVTVREHPAPDAGQRPHDTGEHGGQQRQRGGESGGDQGSASGFSSALQRGTGPP